MDKNKTLNAFLLGVLAVVVVSAATTTTNLGLFRLEKGDTDYVANQTANMNTLEAAILDKRVGGTVIGNLTVTGVIISTSTPALASSDTFKGALSNSQIQSLTCVDGKGECWAISTDEGDVYTATSTIGWRNSRTGKGP